MVDVQKGKPMLRTWELNENSTRYDQLLAAPSDETMHKYWIGWAAIAIAVGLSSLVVFLGVVSSRKARENAFNVYLLYLMIPDFTFSLLCGVTCALNAANGGYWSEWMCNFQQFYVIFGIGANAWLNAAVSHQLYKLLRFSYQRRKYQSPSRAYVTKQAIAVYLYCAFLGCWGFIEKENFPYHIGAPSGLACLPIETDKQSTIFFWLCFFPLFVGIPIAYVAYVSYEVFLGGKLLPPTGKRRILTVYFFRLILVFLVMWIPAFILMFIAATWLPPWAHYAGGTWSHLQGAVSAGVSLYKPDIWDAVVQFVTCQYGEDRRGKDGELGSSHWYSKSMNFNNTNSGRLQSTNSDAHSGLQNTAGSSTAFRTKSENLSSEFFTAVKKVEDSDTKDCEAGDVVPMADESVEREAEGTKFVSSRQLWVDTIDGA